MQSGKAKTKRWRMEFVPDSGYFIDPLMGWSGMRDTTRELGLSFASSDEAVAYATANGLEYELAAPHKRKQVKKSYADNFKFNKVS